jgi:fructose 1,6-bisphosphatase
MEIAAIITAAGVAMATLLGLLGTAVRYVVKMILDAYKTQADATIAAKDRDLKAKDDDITRLESLVSSKLEDIHRDTQSIRQGLGT